MKDRIVFFILGGIVATVGFIIGSLKSMTTEGDTRVFENIRIKGSIIVGETEKPHVEIYASENSAQVSVFNGVGNPVKSDSVTLFCSTPGEVEGIWIDGGSSIHIVRPATDFSELKSKVITPDH